MDQIKVSVCMITYNHEAFIGQAIESVVCQKGNFNLELVIGEDCSSDGTRSICEVYSRNFPHLIRLLPSVTNLGVVSNLIRVLEGCEGQYLAFCEGDDFWGDPSKLQKQVDFLEAHIDFVACYHDVKVVGPQNELIINSKRSGLNNHDLTGDQLIKGRVMSLSTLCCRNVLKNLPDELRKVHVADKFINSLLGQFGKGKFMPEILPSNYRMHQGGIWSKKTEEYRRMKLVLSYFWIWQYYERMKMPEYASHYYRLILREGYFSVPSTGASPTRIDRLETFLLKFIRRFFWGIRRLLG